MGARTVIPLMFLLLLAAAPAAAQPALSLLVDPATAAPSERATLKIEYLGDQTVVDMDASFRFDQRTFSSAVVRCAAGGDGIVIRCDSRALAAGENAVVLTLNARSRDGDTPLPAELPLVQVVLTVAPTAPPGALAFLPEAQRYRDAAGTSVAPAGIAEAVLEILGPARPGGLSRSGTSRGDALLFPYVTTRRGRETLVVLQNQSPFAKALRLNVREGANGRSLVNRAIGSNLATGFNVYLGPGERARFRLFQDPGSGRSRLDTTACTLPVVPSGGLVLEQRQQARGDAITTEGVEGFVTVLAMADLGETPAALLADGACATLVQGFAPNGPWATDPTNGTTAPAGPVNGVFAVRGLPGRSTWEDGAVGLRGFSPGNAHRPPWETFTLGDARTDARVGDDLFSFATGAEAASAVLMREASRLQVRTFGVEWVLSMPTKWLFTDAPFAIGGPPVPPFNEAFDGLGSCDPATLFPTAMPTARELCFNVNVVPFDVVGAGTGSSAGQTLFASAYAVEPVAAIDDVRARVDYEGTGLADVEERILLPGLPVLAQAVPWRAGASRALDRFVGVGASGPPQPGPVKGAAGDASTGASVTVAGRLVFVGAPGADGGRGAVFVFRRHGTALVPEATLAVPPEFDVARFGAALAADGGQVIVGAPGVVPPEAKNGLDTMQAAIWQRLDAQWSLKTPITMSATGVAEGEGFGTSVALEGDSYAIGIPGDDGMGPDAGAVYFFDGVAASFVRPEASSQRGGFGTSLVLKQGVMGVGSPLAAVAGASAGSVSMYGQIASNLQSTVLSDPTPDDGDAFGAAIAFNGSQLAVGAPGANGGAAGEIDNQGQVNIWNFDAGAFRVFGSVIPQDSAVNARFGAGLSLPSAGSGPLVVGAPGALGAFGSGALYEYSQVQAELVLDQKTSPPSDDVAGFGQSVATDGEVIIIGAPQTQAEAGAALAVIDAEVLFFDDFESALLR